ncbi:MAG: response regulator [Thermodesulfobacteriota bacterium]
MPLATSNARSARVKDAAVEQLFSQSRIGSVGAIIGSTVLVWCLWKHVEHWLLLVWLSGLIILHAFRWALNGSYHHRRLAGDPRLLWEYLATGAIVLSGLWWGIGSVAIFPPHSLIAQFILALCLAGVACVAAVLYSPSPIGLVVVLSALLPLSVRFLYEGGETGLKTGIGILVYAGFLAFVSRRLHRMNKSFLALRFEREEFIATLSQEKAKAEALVEELNQEVANRKKDQTALRESERRYRALVETARDVIWSTDLNLRYTYMSPAVTEVLGYTVEEIIGVSLVETMTPESRERLLEELSFELDRALRQPCSRSASVVREAEQHHKDGSVRIVEMTVNFLRDEADRPTGLIGISRDITTRKRESEELERALVTSLKLREEAEAANAAKSQFLANMSHELRTPLNAVIGFSEILTDEVFGSLNPQQLRYLNHIANSGHHLLQLINDVLDLAKVEAGKMELNPVWIEIRGLLENALVMIGETTVRKKLATGLHVSEDLETAKVHVDHLKLKQVMFNLLSNAAKFTPEGGSIDVRARLEGKHLVVSVSDTGIGIRPRDQERIFDSFVQVDSSYSRREQGTGLGLTLSRRLVELHGGRIWVESAGEGAGSSFIFAIPTDVRMADMDLRNDLLPERIDLELASLTDELSIDLRDQVLVVEDDEATGDMISQCLLEAGYSVLRARNGEEAIQVAMHHRPFAITLDVIMPRKDGFDTLIQLKRLEETRDIPVVLVTIYDDRKLGLALGAVDLLVKPLDKDRLLAALGKIRNRSSNSAMSVLVVDDEPLVLENLSAILTISGFKVFKASNGRSGIVQALRCRPDVIIVDLLMPDINGFEVIERLRKTPDTRNIPIIVYTAKDLSEDDRSQLTSHVQAIALKSQGGHALLQHLNLLRTGCP